ncbi:ribosome maturation factor RimP [Marivibrio halodurans]|uniref:Ribosome maturation factor RimP n=2 Tax=Marivibrio halodurans TaxID=2039722 RepID=A0A8J7S4M6_9PROT|nr:ribosome maturation factor RimP [Marivibrio halodurans]
MAIEARIRELIEPAIEEMGFEIVRVRYSGSKRPTLQIMADRKDEAPISVDDCADISRAVSAILDVDDPIPDAYSLEVSSPGIDRPLVRPRDYERFAGFEAKVELARMTGGQKRFRGMLAGIEEGDVLLDMTEDGAKQTTRVRLPFTEIATAKLVLTDALIAWAEAQQEEHDLYDEDDVEFEDGVEADANDDWDDDWDDEDTEGTAAGRA